MTVTSFLSDVDKYETPALLTPFSIVHFLSGAASAAVLYGMYGLDFQMSFVIFFVAHFIYEYKDYRNSYILRVSNDNTLENSVADQICGIIGFLTTVYLWDRKVLQVYVVPIVTLYFIMLAMFTEYRLG